MKTEKEIIEDLKKRNEELEAELEATHATSVPVGDIAEISRWNKVLRDCLTDAMRSRCLRCNVGKYDRPDLNYRCGNFCPEVKKWNDVVNGNWKEYR